MSAAFYSYTEEINVANNNQIATETILSLSQLQKEQNIFRFNRNEVIKEIEIKDIQAIHSRAEEFGKDKTYREKYNVAVSRAVARLNILVEYLLPTVKVGGTCICMKGPDAQEEIREAKNAIQLLGGELEKVEEFTLPDTDIKRTIITIKKTKNTPNKYPRKAGNPAKNPIK